MKFISQIRKRLEERKFTKNKMHLLDNALNIHEEETKKHQNALNLSLVAYLAEFSLNLDFGRQFGHSTYIKNKLYADPNSVLIYERENTAKLSFGDHFFNKMKKGKRAFQLSENTRGLRFDFEEGKLVTILIDKSTFNTKETKYTIASKIVEKHMCLLKDNQVRLVFLG